MTPPIGAWICPGLLGWAGSLSQQRHGHLARLLRRSGCRCTVGTGTFHVECLWRVHAQEVIAGTAREILPGALPRIAFRVTIRGGGSTRQGIAMLRVEPFPPDAPPDKCDLAPERAVPAGPRLRGPRELVRLWGDRCAG